MHRQTTVAACVILAMSALPGCYFWRGFNDHPVAPTLPPETTIELKTRRDSTNAYCSEDNLDGCRLKNGHWRKNRPYTNVSFKAGGKDLTKGEFRALVSPEDHAKRWHAVDKNDETCKLSRIPTYLALVSGAVAIVGMAWAYSERDQVADGTWSAAKVVTASGYIGAGALWAASYPIGGYACVRGGKAMQENAVDFDDDRSASLYDDEGGQKRLRELEQLVEEFNSRAQSALPTTEPTTE